MVNKSIHASLLVTTFVGIAHAGERLPASNYIGQIWYNIYYRELFIWADYRRENMSIIGWIPLLAWCRTRSEEVRNKTSNAYKYI